jgi:hypothetical protein
MKDLEREVRELRRTNEIFQKVTRPLIPDPSRPNHRCTVDRSACPVLRRDDLIDRHRCYSTTPARSFGRLATQDVFFDDDE